jgi:3-oxoacyl-[acyl-carrier protein] reductase
MALALVTGAGRGLGRAIAERLGRDGYSVVAVDVDGESAAATAAGVGGTGYPCDVSDRTAVRRLAEAVGPVDVLVNNAGIWAYGSVIAAADEDIDRVLAVNLMGVLNCCRAFLPQMESAGRGAIVNLSSVAAPMAVSAVEIYPVTKAAIELLTRQLALEFGPKGIRVNAIGPGSMLTEGSAAAYEGERKAQRAAMVPLRRVGTPKDIADAVGFLVSEQASYITGQILYVDGGISAASR